MKKPLQHDRRTSTRWRTAFTLTEFLTAAAVVVVSLALLMPAVLTGREDARRRSCQDNLQNLALACSNYADVNKRLPAATVNTDTTADIPGSAEAPGKNSSGAGFSWLALILPYTDECEAPFRIVWKASDGLQSTAFDENVVDTFPDSPTAGRHIMSLRISTFMCPAFAGKPMVESDPVAKVDPPANYTRKGNVAGLTNYNAMVGTHIGHVGLPGMKSPVTAPVDNGAFRFCPTQYDLTQEHRRNRRGHSFDTFADGTSLTLLIAETKERALSAWMDGTTTWLVAARHVDDEGNSLGTTAGEKVGEKDSPETTPVTTGKGDYAGRWVHATKSRAVLNVGPAKKNPKARYLLADTAAFPNLKADRSWGPSSDHPSGVNHAFADCHVKFLSDDIDSNVYLWLTTRNGSESGLNP